MRFIKILKNQILDCFFTLSRNARSIEINFAFVDVLVKKINVELNMLFIIQFSNEAASNKIDISNYWNSEYRFKMQKILNRHNKFFNDDLSKFNNNIEMFIFFRNKIDIFDFKQNSYFLIARNKKAMNEIFNSFVKQKRIQKFLFETSSFAFSSTFVVWKNDKLRIVINFKKINTRFYSDVYFLSKQNTILKILSDFIIFSSIDLIKNFFQQNIRQQDWWKTIFVIFHREQKWLTVFIMNFVNTSNFFQHKIKFFLTFYLWKFVFVYIDNIIIYFFSLNDYIKHVDDVLTFLKNSDITFSLFKCHFVYSSIQTLNHYVSRLDFNTIQEKIETIRNMKFSRNLRDFEVDLKFFDYYRFFVNHYAIIAKSLVRLKTQNFIDASMKKRKKRNYFERTTLKQRHETYMKNRFYDKRRFTNTTIDSSNDDRTNINLSTNFACVKVWNTFKKKFCTTYILTYSNFFKSFILYVDDNNKKTYDAILHQIDNDDVKRSILFIFRDLSNVEIRYWITKLKVEALIWVLIKLFQYFDDDTFIVITDHTALKETLQTKIKNQRLTRLNEWSMFFFTYFSRMKIIHRFEKSHQNVDELFRLFIYDVEIYSTIILSANEKFHAFIRNSLSIDSHFDKIYNKLKQQIKNTIKKRSIYKSFINHIV